jgi:predicted TIM-barrel fold metal-dependent hydrolase
MHHSPTQAAFETPSLACDTHFHVFGTPDRYPYQAEELRYAPPVAEIDDYLELAAALGIQRMVLVQPSAYGRDNTCMLDAMQSLDPAVRRGIVDIDENANDSEFARLDALGVRGVRINVNPIKPLVPGFSETMRRRIARLDARCSELGWSLDFLLPGWLTAELLPDMKGLRSNFSVAHLGMNLARDGITTAGFTGLVDLLKHGEGRCWVKLTGTYRISTQPGFDDIAPLVQTLSQAAADRLIWGSDYPHLSFAENDTVVLFNLLARWLPDPALRQKVLVDNPATLYGF